MYKSNISIPKIWSHNMRDDFYQCMSAQYKHFLSMTSPYYIAVFTVVQNSQLHLELLEIGAMRPLVIGDWWVQKNKTAKMSWPLPLYKAQREGVNWHRRHWGLHGAVDQMPAMYKCYVVNPTCVFVAMQQDHAYYSLPCSKTMRTSILRLTL